MRRASALLATTALALLMAGGAVAADAPPYDGTMGFGTIHGPAEPEEFSWEVELDEDEELRAIDDRHAGVYWLGEGEEVLTMTIVARAAHDAEGADVPTSIAVTQPNLITLIVHHRAGNPAAGGASFTYPVNLGEGWEGGIQTHVVQMPPAEPPVPAPVALSCQVPDLGGRTLNASRRMLRRSSCKLGPVRGERRKGARVTKQYRIAGRSLPAGTEVGVKLG